MFRSSSFGEPETAYPVCAEWESGLPLRPPLSFRNASSFVICNFSYTLPEPGYGLEVLQIPVSILCSDCFRLQGICFEFASRMDFAHVFFELWGL